jgi:hypothetical protein
MRAGRWRFGAAAAALAVVASGFMARSTAIGLDYLAPPCDPGVCDDASLPINALLAGDLSGFFAQQVPMGAFSILLRVPFAIFAESDLGRYRTGSFACLLVVGLLAAYVAYTMFTQGRSWMAWTVVPAGLLVNPLTYQTMYYGHPEEGLAAALSVGAVLAAARSRVLLAAALLGCAIATKQWAVLAVLPVLIAAPAGGRTRLSVAGAAVVLVLTVPMVIGDPDRFLAAQRAVGVEVDMQYSVTSANVWWPFSSESYGLVETASGPQRTAQYSLPQSFAVVSRVLVIALGLGLAVLYARRRRDAEPEDVLALLALIFLLRCMLDPLSYSYHHLPFLVALIAWEGLRKQIPVASGISIAAIAALQFVVAPTNSAGLVNAFYLLWTVPLVAYLTMQAFAPGIVERLAVKGRVLVRGPQAVAASRQ